jgi:hypothetical protein
VICNGLPRQVFSIEMWSIIFKGIQCAFEIVLKTSGWFSGLPVATLGIRIKTFDSCCMMIPVFIAVHSAQSLQTRLDVTKILIK